MANYLSPIGNGVPFLDDNGDPLAGALLFTYTSGSSTKKTTYTDEDGATANTNPIELDADGYAPNPIWLIGGATYKFLLAPADDTDPPSSTIKGPWDNINGINDTSVSIDQWIDVATPTFVDTNTFTLVGDQTTDFHVNRRLKLTVSAGTVYGYISASAFTTLTTIDVVLDSGDLDDGLSAVQLALLTANNQSYPNDIATTDTTQTITGTKTFTSSSGLIVQSDDAGATVGPELNIYRNSASPAAADLLGAVNIRGEDSAGNAETYARIYGEIVDTTSTAEDGRLHFGTVIGGTLASRGYAQNGFVIGGATGGDQGVGTINAGNFYVDGNAINLGAFGTSLILIATGDASTSASVDLIATLTSYEVVMVTVSNAIPTTDGAHLAMRVFVSSVAQTGASDYVTTLSGFDTAGSTDTRQMTDNLAELTLDAANWGLDSSGSGWSGNIFLYSPAGGITNKQITIWGSYRSNVPVAAVNVIGSCSVALTSALNGVQFLMSSDTIASGTFRMYGIKKA